MIAKTELEMLEEALKDYKKFRFRLKRPKRLTGGFCKYFTNADEYIPDSIFSFKPSSMYKYARGYWYKPGKLYPRINLLKKAIKICKQKIKDANN